MLSTGHLKRCQLSVVHASVLQVGVASKYTSKESTALVQHALVQTI